MTKIQNSTNICTIQVGATCFVLLRKVQNSFGAHQACYSINTVLTFWG